MTVISHGRQLAFSLRVTAYLSGTLLCPMLMAQTAAANEALDLSIGRAAIEKATEESSAAAARKKPILGDKETSACRRLRLEIDRSRSALRQATPDILLHERQRRAPRTGMNTPERNSGFAINLSRGGDSQYEYQSNENLYRLELRYHQECR